MVQSVLLITQCDGNKYLRFESPISRSPGPWSGMPKIGKLLSGNPDATAEDGIQWVRNFCKHAKIQPLSSFGLTESQFSKIIEKALQSSSMKGNPITLSEDELRNILQMSVMTI